MRLRTASITDARRISEVHVRSWQTAYRNQVPNAYLDSLSIAHREEVWIGIIQEVELPASGVFVIEDDDEVVVGFAGITGDLWVRGRSSPRQFLRQLRPVENRERMGLQVLRDPAAHPPETKDPHGDGQADEDSHLVT